MRPRPRDGREERGAAAVFVSLILVVLLLIAGFAVDLGVQRVARTDAQSLADVVALDLVRDLEGRTVAQIGSLQPAADASRDRNLDVAGFDPDDPPEITSIELGELDDLGAFVAGSTTAGYDPQTYVPTAVRVGVNTDVGFAFAGITGDDEGEANRRAVATADESACFRLGSFIASLDSRQSALLNPILSALFGSTVNLTAVGYQGLADADVSLLDLVEVGGLNVGSVDQLLALENVSAADLFLAAANVLDQQGNAAQADVLRALALKLPTPTIDIAELIEAAPGSQAALDASINVLDLVTGTVLVANEDHAVAIPNLGISLPGVGTVAATLTVIESPRTVCGPVGTTNETAQVRLTASIHLSSRLLSVPVLGTSVELKETDLTLSFDLGKAIAELKDVNCPTGEAESITVDLRSGILGSISLAGSLGVKARVDPIGSLLNSILSLLNLGSLLKPPYLTLDSSVSLAAGAPPATTYDKTGLVVPLPEGYETPTGSGTGDILQPLSVTPVVNTDLVLHYWEGLLLLGQWKERHLTDPLNTVFNSVLSPITSTIVSSILNPLVQALQEQLVKPLADLLGLQLGGADVFAVPTPTCGAPRLVG